MEDANHIQDTIRRVQLLFSVFYSTTLSKQDVTLRQFSVLVALVKHQEPLKMSLLSQALHISLPAVTHLVDQLESKQLIKRQPHPTDRRINLIELTSRGQQVARQTQGKALHVLTQALEGFSVKEKQTVQHFMSSMAEGLEEAIESS